MNARRVTLYVWASVLAGLSAIGACGGTTTLISGDGGPNEDSGHDSSTTNPADTGTRPIDAGSFDVVVDTSTPFDGGSPVDTSTPFDVGQPFDGGHPVDTGLSDGFVGFDAGNFDSGPVCAPDPSAMSFTPTWVPPAGPYSGACTSQQISDFITACFASTATQATCSPWIQNAANKTCLNCTIGPETSATTWAPLVFTRNPGEADWINLGGCVELSDPSQSSCAHALEASFQCEMAACLNNCPIPATNAMQSDFDKLNTCVSDADMGPCAAEANNTNTSCAGTVDGGAAGWCFNIASDMTNALLGQFFNLACGSAPSDAGGN